MAVAILLGISSAIGEVLIRKPFMNNAQFFDSQAYKIPLVPEEKLEDRSPDKDFPSIKKMVKDAFDRGASDIHIRVGQFPRFRIKGQMLVPSGYIKVTREMYRSYLGEILTLSQMKQFAQKKELDTAIYYPGLVRCRVNCFDSLTGGGIVMRLISLSIPSIDELKLPPVLKEIVSQSQGLILVTGPTGSGKSTTIAAMIRHLNETVNKHIVTIEDPIEFVHPSQNCLISQREVGLHTYHFHQALRSALREDPDVILIGEMRDRITVEIALQAAQTGHLVLGTLHTSNAVGVVNRLLTLYNPEEQEPMRVQIVEALLAVISQTLLKTTEDKRRAVHDILINTPTMKDYLFKGNLDEAFRLMENDLEGMQTMNQAIYQLLNAQEINVKEAWAASPDPNTLERMVRTGNVDSKSSAREWMM
jgi:twitching motility protein PilT